MISLGLDIGSNSVGSAWVDTDRQEIHLGVSVFPAGVDEQEKKRGAPKNQDRRQKRSQRRSLARRAERKRQLRELLVAKHLLPHASDDLRALFNANRWPPRSSPDGSVYSVWHLRRDALVRELHLFEFGRVLVHLNQRRGALGVETDREDKDEGKVKEAIDRTRDQINELGLRTFGQLMAAMMDRRAHAVVGKAGNFYFDSIRNRADAFEFHADRALIREEFIAIWEKQRSFRGELAALLTDEWKKVLDNPVEDETWRHRGAIFGQRRTYWDAGTLGRCDLEPTDHRCPQADMYAQQFRVVETVNNIRVEERGKEPRPLTPEEREKVIVTLGRQKSATPATVRKALGIDKKGVKAFYTLNVERDAGQDINTNWFWGEIVQPVFGAERWTAMSDRQRESVNRAILKFDPSNDRHEQRLRRGAVQWWGLSSEAADRLIEGWRTRPKLEKRLNLSRRAIRNLLPYMERPIEADGKLNWPTQIEARKLFAEDGGHDGSFEQRRRYALGSSSSTKAERQYLAKHPNSLPPAPTMTNPVVRKAIHEVRRHVIEHIRSHGGTKPDRVVIEFAREASKPAKVSDRILYLSRSRHRIRATIVEEVVKPHYGSQFHRLSQNQLRAAVDRVVLARQQRGVCAYTGKPITERMAAVGEAVEVDHVIPYSCCGDNSLNNRVLCFRDSNRDKGRRTPRMWWGDRFDEKSGPMQFMEGHRPPKDDYFTARDYAAKWRNFACAELPQEWRGSQLTDTAYAAREVHDYLQRALWPGEPSHLQGGQRRIFVTKGAYTAILRKDWQLYQTLISPAQASAEEMQQAVVKNRGDHREHAIDALVIALTDPQRILDLARHAQILEESRASRSSRDRSEIRRKPLPPPWGDVWSFRRDVLKKVYDVFDPIDPRADTHPDRAPLVVSHRPVGRKIVGKFHEETLFGPVPEDKALFTGRRNVADLEPNHLRLPQPESRQRAVRRLTDYYAQQGIPRRQAKQRAEETLNSPSYRPCVIDPTPEKSGLVRDRQLRRILRTQINERLAQLGINRTADDFTKGDMKKMLEKGPFCMPSGVPIRRVRLLRTMKDPVVIRRKRWNPVLKRMDYYRPPDDNESKPRHRTDRIYVGGNNHHIEIREDDRGRWSGQIVPAIDAARRVRDQTNRKRSAVDRSDDPAKGGRFIMSLAEGETVYMRDCNTRQPGYFVVFKLDKPQTVQFKHHWDARRAKGEKDDDGNVIPGSRREELAVTASKLREWAPPEYRYPVKVRVSPIGDVTLMNRD